MELAEGLQSQGGVRHMHSATREERGGEGVPAVIEHQLLPAGRWWTLTLSNERTEDPLPLHRVLGLQ